MKLNFRLFMVGFMALMWLSTSVYAGSLIAPELEVPKDKAKNQVLTTVLKWKPVSGAKSYRIFVAASADTLNKLAAGSPCKDCFVDEKSDIPTYQDPPKTFQKGYSVFLDCSGSQRYRRRAYCYCSLIYNGIDIFRGHGLMTGIRSHN